MRLAVLWLATGCTQILGVHEFDAPPPDAEARTCRGDRWSYCTTSLPGPRTLANDLDTDDPACADRLVDGTPACVIASTALTVSKLRAHGGRPLVLVGDMVTIAGALDASSDGAIVGPGADPVACEPATPGWNETPAHLQASGGGAGGSFGAAGGTGGDTATGVFNGGQVEGGGVPAAAMVLRGLYGGCPGSAGGAPTQLMPAAAGHGGGAVLVIANALELDATIDAGGGGGAAGGAQGGGIGISYSGGGGGGGAGGLVVLEIGSLIGTGSVFANGGGGGGGGLVSGINPTSGLPGADGGEGCALGGGGGVGGGAGGCSKHDAAGGNSRTSVDGLTTGSGGGGGGAVGIVLSTVPLANASPKAGTP